MEWWNGLGLTVNELMRIALAKKRPATAFKNYVVALKNIINCVVP